MPSIDSPAGLGERSVALRPLEQGDAAAFAQAFRDDPELGRLLALAEDPSEQWAREAARRSREGAQEGRMIALAITGAEGGGFRGEIVLNGFHWKHRRCELGYWVVPRARGRGVATAALGLAVDGCSTSWSCCEWRHHHHREHRLTGGAPTSARFRGNAQPAGCAIWAVSGGDIRGPFRPEYLVQYEHVFDCFNA